MAERLHLAAFTLRDASRRRGTVGCDCPSEIRRLKFWRALRANVRVRVDQIFGKLSKIFGSIPC